MEQSERPSIELYMYSLNQEFPAGKGHDTYLKRYSEMKPDLRGDLSLNAGVETQIYRTKGGDSSASIPADWSAQWLENRWVQNHTKSVGVGVREQYEPIKNAIIREEDFGAILFEPTSDRVYKLNKAGLELFRKIRAAYLDGKAPSDLPLDDDSQSFVKAMSAAGLVQP